MNRCDFIDFKEENSVSGQPIEGGIVVDFPYRCSYTF